MSSCRFVAGTRNGGPAVPVDLGARIRCDHTGQSALIVRFFSVRSHSSVPMDSCAGCIGSIGLLPGVQWGDSSAGLPGQPPRSAREEAKARKARPRCDTAAFSPAVISANVRPSPPSETATTKTGS